MPWLGAFFATVIVKVFSLVFDAIIYVFGKRVGVAVLFITVSGTLFLTCAFAVKTLILSIRVTMPNTLAPFTYFLPGSINFFVATAILIRVTYFVFTWSLANLAAFLAPSK